MKKLIGMVAIAATLALGLSACGSEALPPPTKTVTVVPDPTGPTASSQASEARAIIEAEGIGTASVTDADLDAYAVDTCGAVDALLADQVPAAEAAQILASAAAYDWNVSVGDGAVIVIAMIEAYCPAEAEGISA